MQYGFVLPDIDLQNIGNLARDAEEAGWDGIFIPDCISIETKNVPAFPFFDPWVALGLVAVATSRIRFGTMVTAVPRRRPWKLARETMTLDRLSNGRLILAVGLGAAADDAGFYKVGEKMDLKSRAELLDEGLEILAGCWSGKPFSFRGKHYQVDEYDPGAAPNSIAANTHVGRRSVAENKIHESRASLGRYYSAEIQAAGQRHIHEAGGNCGRARLRETESQRAGSVRDHRIGNYLGKQPQPRIPRASAIRGGRHNLVAGSDVGRLPGKGAHPNPARPPAGIEPPSRPNTTV